ncbi:hypothetical protein R3P38DRAFT_2881595 [Favolaschia claudopus]|uniref:F-box domain-containing protein n=1 Tax=Favolaschia claudopus TaxID=2862362 RepID=A0AAW0D0M9_9AGAR
MKRHKLDLPVELEREIFELAASTDVGTALRLALVAHRVQTWVEPIIYSKVVVVNAPEVDRQMQLSRSILRGRTSKNPSARKATNEPQIHRFIRTIPLRPASFFARHVSSLQVGNLTEPELVTVLSTCTGISELGWWSSNITPSVGEVLHALKLRRLSVDHTFEFEQIHTTSMFATITHLDLSFRNTFYRHDPPPLKHFTALTHLSVVHGSLLPPTSWCDDILKLCPRLKILLRVSDTLFFEEVSGYHRRHSDLRVVVMQPPIGAWTAPWVHDAWPLAEKIVRERRELAAAEAAAAKADTATVI